jgi:hypothetical protein
VLVCEASSPMAFMACSRCCRAAAASNDGPSKANRPTFGPSQSGRDNACHGRRIVDGDHRPRGMHGGDGNVAVASLAAYPAAAPKVVSSKISVSKNFLRARDHHWFDSTCRMLNPEAGERKTAIIMNAQKGLKPCIHSTFRRHPATLFSRPTARDSPWFSALSGGVERATNDRS